MRAKGKKRFANILIFIGVVMLAIGIGYEAINYPWRIVMQKMGVPVSDQLPDPKPLTLFTFPDYEATPDGQLPEALPADNGGLPLQRPQLRLTMVGTIKIPKIGISENIVEGTGDEMLYAVGHQPGTAFPGKPGNCVLAGHRNYIQMHPFKYLPKVEVGDQVIVSAEGVTYTYEIYNTFEVAPEDTWVVQPQEGEESMLTLITCTPIPTYTKRFIAQARLVA